MQKEEDGIVKSIIELWKTIVLCNPNLIDSFYTWTREPEELVEVEKILKEDEAKIEEEKNKNLKESEKTKLSVTVIKNSQELLLAGLLNHRFEIRKGFRECLEIIASNIKTNEGKRPLYYFLNMLKNNFPQSKKDVKDFFEFFDYCITLFAKELEAREDGSQDEDLPE